MRKKLSDILKRFLREQLLQARDQLHYTQEEMAHLLLMSTRSYASLESGESCCGIITFLLFLMRCCPDPIELLVKLTIHFDRCVETSPEMVVSRQWMRKHMPTAVEFYQAYGDRPGYPVCPACGAPIARDFQPFCAQCAQALDWSDAYREEEALSQR